MDADSGPNCRCVRRRWGIWRGSQINRFNYARWGEAQDLLAVFIIEERWGVHTGLAHAAVSHKKQIPWPGLTSLLGVSELVA